MKMNQIQQEADMHKAEVDKLRNNASCLDRERLNFRCIVVLLLFVLVLVVSLK